MHLSGWDHQLGGLTISNGNQVNFHSFRCFIPTLLSWTRLNVVHWISHKRFQHSGHCEEKDSFWKRSIAALLCVPTDLLDAKTSSDIEVFFFTDLIDVASTTNFHYSLLVKMRTSQVKQKPETIWGRGESRVKQFEAGGSTESRVEASPKASHPLGHLRLQSNSFPSNPKPTTSYHRSWSIVY